MTAQVNALLGPSPSHALRSPWTTRQPTLDIHAQGMRILVPCTRHGPLIVPPFDILPQRHDVFEVRVLEEMLEEVFVFDVTLAFHNIIEPLHMLFDGSHHFLRR